MAYDLVVVGTSLGGLYALRTLFAALPRDFPIAMAVVQHRHRDSDETLRNALQRTTALAVCEAEDKQPLTPGQVCLAPADYHLMVENGTFALSTDEPVLYARPSIDVLFESAANAYGPRVIGVILTGASADGAAGLAAIKARGGMTVVQEPTTAECRVMPEAALANVAADYVLPLDEIARLLVRLATAHRK